jgi:acyl carrier protein
MVIWVKTTILQLLSKIAPDIDPQELEMDANIREVFGIDSFDFLQFIIGLDEEFGITTPEEDYGKITTLNTLMAYLKLASNKQV